MARAVLFSRSLGRERGRIRICAGSPAGDDLADDDSDPVLAGKNANNLLRPVSDPKTPTQDIHNVGRRSARTKLREPVQPQSPINVRSKPDRSHTAVLNSST